MILCFYALGFGLVLATLGRAFHAGMATLGFLCPRFRAGLSDAWIEFMYGEFKSAKSFYALGFGLVLATFTLYSISDHLQRFYALGFGLVLATDGF